MPKTVRGGNNSFRVKRQRIQKFSKTRDELEAMTKSALLDEAERLMVLDDIPRNADSDTPLKSDIVEHLVDLKNQTLQ